MCAVVGDWNWEEVRLVLIVLMVIIDDCFSSTDFDVARPFEVVFPKRGCVMVISLPRVASPPP